MSLHPFGSGCTGAAVPADLACQRSPSAGMQATVRSLQLDERMIALAAAISIDYDYFSQHSHGHGLLGPMMFPGKLLA